MAMMGKGLRTKQKPLEAGSVVLKYKENRGKDGKLYGKYRGSVMVNGKNISISVPVSSDDSVLSKEDRRNPDQKIIFVDVAVFNPDKR